MIIRLLILVVCILECNLVVSQKETKYEEGKAYHYIYNSYLLNGMLDSSSHFSGFLFNSSVTLNYVSTSGSDKIFVLSLKSPKLRQVNGDVSPMSPADMDPPMLDRRVLSALKGNAKLVSALEEPIKFKWTAAGHISGATPSPKDTRETYNLKKGILTMFSGNFTQELPKSGKCSANEWQMETQIDGKCPTAYFYKRLKGTLYEVMKMRDLIRCKKRPVYQQSDLRINTCKNPFDPEWPRKLERIRSESNTRYEMVKENKDTFMIRLAKTYSRYGMKPPGERGQLLNTFVNQVLTYQRMSSTGAPATDDSKKATDLMMEIQGMPPKFSSMKKFNKAADELLKKLKKNKKTVKFAKKLASLTMFLRRASKQQIMSFLKKAEKKGLRSYVEDTLGAVGSNACNQVIVDLIKGSKYSIRKLTKIIMFSSVTSSKPKELLDAFEKLSSDPAMLKKKRLPLIPTLWAGMGSLYSAMRVRLDMSDKSLSKRAIKFIKAQTKIDHSPMSSQSKITALLLSVGNTGLKGLSPIIIKYLKPNYSGTIRMTAMRAWRKLAPQMPKVTRKVMFGYFCNFDEDDEIRIGAYVNFARSRPSRYHLSMLIQVIRSELVDNVRNFVVSQLVGAAIRKVPNICYAPAASNARWAIQSMTRVEKEIQPLKSRVFYNPIRGFGWLAHYGLIIYNRNQALPRVVTLTSGGSSSDSVFQFWSITLRRVGGQRSLRRLLGSYSSIFGSIRGSMKKGYPKTKKTGKGKPKKDDDRDEVQMIYSLFGEDLVAISEDPATFLRYMKDAVFNNDMAYLIEDNIKLATTIGLPVALNQALAGVRQSKMKTKITRSKKSNNVEIKYKLTSAHLMTVQLGSRLGTVRHQVGLDMSMAMFPGGKSELVMNMARKKAGFSFSMHITPMGKENKLIEFRGDVYQKSVNGTDVKVKKMKFFSPRKMYKKTIMKKMNAPIQISRLVQPDRPRAMTMKLRAARYARGNTVRLPMYYSLVRKPGKVCGLGFDIKRTKVAQQSGGDENGEAIGGEVDEEIFEEEFEGEDEDGPDDLSLDDVTDIEDMDQSATMKKGKKVKLMKVSTKSTSGGQDTLLSYSSLPKMPLGLQNNRMTIQFNQFSMSKKKMKKLPIGTLAFTMQQNAQKRSMSMRMKMKVGMSSVVMKGKFQSTGPDIFFNPANPFEVTTNAGTLASVQVKQGDREIFSMKREKKMSKGWVDAWKKLLKKPDQLLRDYPAVYRCAMDTKEDSMYSTTPQCVKAWEILQQSNDVKYEIKYGSEVGRKMTSFNMEVMGGMLRRLYGVTGIDLGKDESTISQTFLPTNTRMLRRRRVIGQFLKGWPFMSKCDLNFYKKTNRVFVNTFDGYSYNGDLGSNFFKSKSLVLAQDRRMGQFTVALSYSDSKPSIIISYTMRRGTCKITVTPMTGEVPKTTTEGKACSIKTSKGTSKTYSTSDKNYFGFNAVTISIPGRGISVSTNPGEYTRIIAGMRYHDSLRGVCGNMDRERRWMEMLEKSCAMKDFQKPDAFVSDYVVSDPFKLQNCP